ncbi:MAG: DUF2062 domain-containing protein [Victivallaceae bacterium]|nr:DUF2062 domain-containing protein [Victivallaceae bacterium]
MSGWWSRFKRKCAALYRLTARGHRPPSYAARGWAIGMFYGCAMPFGAQLVFSVPTAFLLKADKIGAVLGTLITNHFTIFIIYPFQCWVGAKLLGIDLSYAQIAEAMKKVVAEQTFSSLASIGGRLVSAFFAGGIMFAAIMTPITYFVVAFLVTRYRRIRDKIAATRKSN